MGRNSEYKEVLCQEGLSDREVGALQANDYDNGIFEYINSKRERDMEERKGEAFALGEQLTVIGKKLQVGYFAPDFTLDYVDFIDMTIHSTRLTESIDSMRVLSVVNSLDMPVCRLQTQRWEELRLMFPPNVSLYTISMDLPYTQAHWQIAEKVIHQTLSAHRSEQFGLAYGVLLKEWRLLQRAVFVIDQDRRIVYAEYVANQQQEPDYKAACAAIASIVPFS